MRLIHISGIILISLFLGSCSSAAKHKMLKVFFDGVPEEKMVKEKEPQEDKAEFLEEDELSAASLVEEKPLTEDAAPLYTAHFPFAEGKCDVCHIKDFSQTVNVEGKELCFSCHDDFLKEAKVKHFPSAEGMCLDCHNPHQSKNKFLLIKIGQSLCLGCHDKEETITKEPHGEIGEKDCLICHDLHKGEEALLR